MFKSLSEIDEFVDSMYFENKSDSARYVHKEIYISPYIAL